MPYHVHEAAQNASFKVRLDTVPNFACRGAGKFAPGLGRWQHASWVGGRAGGRHRQMLQTAMEEVHPMGQALVFGLIGSSALVIGGAIGAYWRGPHQNRGGLIAFPRGTPVSP